MKNHIRCLYSFINTKYGEFLFKQILHLRRMPLCKEAALLCKGQVLFKFLGHSLKFGIFKGEMVYTMLKAGNLFVVAACHWMLLRSVFLT